MPDSDKCRLIAGRLATALWTKTRVELETGELIADPLAYVGLAAIRRPLLVDGRPVRCADVAQAQAMGLIGAVADTDGLDVTPVG